MASLDDTSFFGFDNDEQNVGLYLPHDPIFAAELEAAMNEPLEAPVACGNYMVANDLPVLLPSLSQIGFLAPAPAPRRPRGKTTGAKTSSSRATAPAPAGVSKKPRAPRAPPSSPLPPATTTTTSSSSASASATTTDDDDDNNIDDIDLTVESYRPKIAENLIPPAKAKVRSEHYGSYMGKFKTSEDARNHRRRSRGGPKRAADTARVKKFGRAFWVERIYEAMIDVSDISDRATSIHRQRFTASRVFDPLDLEAAAHQVFDAALKVHEEGWCRPLIYHKSVVRGKLVDKAATSLELRLSLICELLRTKKAMVDDAVRGGITLALLVDNPTARGSTKSSNDAGNEKRGQRLKIAKELETMEVPEDLSDQESEGDQESPEDGA